VPTVELDPIGIRRALIWAGALRHAPPEAARAQRSVPPDGVYVVGRWYGSPVDRHGLRATHRIVAVDGEPTPDLDRFLAAVADTPDRGSVRLRTEDLDGKTEVLTLELDLRFWPTLELHWNGGGWVRSAPSGGIGSASAPVSPP
jgi:S1-C subfamily serine protease